MVNILFPFQGGDAVLSWETNFPQEEEEAGAKVFTDSEAGQKKNSSQFQVRSAQTTLDQRKTVSSNFELFSETRARTGSSQDECGLGVRGADSDDMRITKHKSRIRL